jgi:hypothetical protein
MATTRQVALATGASSGIGKETARAFAGAGFEAIGTGRKTSGLTPPAGVTYLDLDVASDGSATIRLVTGGPPNIDDLSFLTPWSDVMFVAQNGSSSQNGPDRIVVVYPDGTYKAVLTSADGLASPSATAVRGDRLYITDGGVPEPHGAKPQTAKINFDAFLAAAGH